MDKLTLDTNVLRDWAWSEDRSSESRYDNSNAKKEEIQQLMEILKSLRDSGACELGVTTQLYMDYDHKKPDNLPDYIREMIGPYVNVAKPAIFAFPLEFPVKFVEKEKVKEIFEVVFPNAKPGGKNYDKNYKDALQLYAHLIAERDIFITTDAAILRQRDLLEQKCGIKVKPLNEYVKKKLSYYTS